MRMATPICWGREPGARANRKAPNSKLQTPTKLQIPSFKLQTSRMVTGLLLAVVLFAGTLSFAAEEGSQADCETKARREYWRAKAAHAKDQKDPKAAGNLPGRVLMSVSSLRTVTKEPKSLRRASLPAAS